MPPTVTMKREKRQFPEMSDVGFQGLLSYLENVYACSATSSACIAAIAKFAGGRVRAFFDNYVIVGGRVSYMGLVVKRIPNSMLMYLADLIRENPMAYIWYFVVDGPVYDFSRTSQSSRVSYEMKIVWSEPDHNCSLVRVRAFAEGKGVLLTETDARHHAAISLNALAFSDKYCSRCGYVPEEHDVVAMLPKGTLTSADAMELSKGWNSVQCIEEYGNVVVFHVTGDSELVPVRMMRLVDHCFRRLPNAISDESTPSLETPAAAQGVNGLYTDEEITDSE